MQPRGADFVGRLGSLNTGLAVAALEPDESPESWNVEDRVEAAIVPRNGREEMARVAAQPPVNWAWGYDTEESPEPFLVTHAGGGQLAAGTHLWRCAHATRVGESDTRFARVVETTATEGDHAIVRVRFHLRSMAVASYMESELFRLQVQDNSLLDGFEDDFCVGWEVYPHDPTVADETMLGLNPDRQELIHRIRPAATVLAYVASTKTFHLSHALPNPNDFTRVSIMMPDRAGYPVIAVNVYCKAPGDDHYRQVATVRSMGPVRVDEVDTTAGVKCPETRVTRTAPDVVEFAPTDVDPNLKQRRVVTKTGIEGGIHRVRYAGRSGSADLLLVPGVAPNGRPRNLRALLWPSAATNVAVRGGYGIRVTLPEEDEGVDDWLVYTEKRAADETLDYEGVTSPGFDFAPRAYKRTLLTLPIDTPIEEVPPGFANTEWTTPEYSAGALEDDDPVSRTSAIINVDEFRLPISADQRADSTHAVIRARIRATRASNYRPSSGDKLYLALWDESAQLWTNLAGPFSPRDGWQDLELGIEWDNDRLLANELWVRVHAIGRVGYDIDLMPTVDLYHDELLDQEYYDDVIPTGEELYQDEGPEGDVDLVNPLNDYLGRLIPNTTGQWQNEVFAWPVKTSAAMAEGTAVDRLLVAGADSVFLLRDGALRRVYQEESGDDPVTGAPSLEVLRFPWQAALLEDRAYLCNEGRRGLKNLVFDLVATRFHGLDAPPEGDAGEFRIIDAAGEVDGDKEWLAFYERRVDRPNGFSYFVRSPFARIGEVVNADNATVEALVEIPRDPSVTHVGLARTLTGGSTYYLVERRPVTTALHLGRWIRFVDGNADGALTIPLRAEVETPPPAKIVAAHESYLYLVPQDQPAQVWLSNGANDSGIPDPEAFNGRNRVVPKMPDAKEITALIPSDAGVQAHCRAGAVLLRRASDQSTGASLLIAHQFSGSEGAVGVHAWARVGQEIAFISPKGPSVAAGDTIAPIYDRVDGTVAEAQQTAEYQRFARVFHNETKAKQQVIYMFATLEDGRMDRAVVVHGKPRPTSTWREWRDWSGHGGCRYANALGEPVLVVTDEHGLIHRADVGRTDNGRFVSWRHATADLDLGTPKNRGTQQRNLTLHFKRQEPGNYLLVRTCEDYAATDDVDPRRWQLWDGESVTWDQPGLLWDDADASWDHEANESYIRRVGACGGISTRTRYVFSQEWAHWPVGAPREPECELVGFHPDTHGRPLQVSPRSPS